MAGLGGEPAVHDGLELVFVLESLGGVGELGLFEFGDGEGVGHAVVVAGETAEAGVAVGAGVDAPDGADLVAATGAVDAEEGA